MNNRGYFGQYGGSFVPETLVQPLRELEHAYQFYSQDQQYLSVLSDYLRDFIGRPTPLYYAKRLTQELGGAQLYFKREDLAHTGAHKINNALGQALLAQAMGKRRIVAETGAGQHGVATASVCALLNLSCTVYMGSIDMQRQATNVQRMRLLGAEVIAVQQGSCTLKDAVSEAMRDWVTHVDSYYLLGSALGPHPYPLMVRNFQKIIGEEVRQQVIKMTGRLPDELVACVGGGSNAIGLFYPFLADQQISMTGVEAQGAARFVGGSMGVFQGMKSCLLQDEHGQVLATHSISAGLDYSAVGPEHAHLHDVGRVKYMTASDQAALQAAYTIAQCEGILPALESSHALAYVLRHAPKMPTDYVMVVNISGRGDKDIDVLSQVLRGGFNANS